MRKWKTTAAVFLSAVLLLSGCRTVEHTLPALESGETTQPSSAVFTPTAPPAEATSPTAPPVTIPSPEPPAFEAPTLLSFLRNAIAPVGNTMYIWGGGWNEEDTGAGIDAVTLGLNPNWAAFAEKQDASYNFENHRFQIHDGLDCSGFVGWAIYNTLETENGQEGYVSKATHMAQHLAGRGLGDYIPAEEMTRWLPGDVLSMQGHIWICLGTCGDGSVLLVHSRGAGVSIYGTLLPDGRESDAIRLARSVMQEKYPDWYARYPACASGYSYLQNSSAMRWFPNILSDAEQLRERSAEEILNLLFEKR